jgi:CheY-like chemotaxis protein
MTIRRTGQRIRVVEDHKPLRSLLSFLPSNAGCEIVERADAL